MNTLQARGIGFWPPKPTGPGKLNESLIYCGSEASLAAVRVS